MTHDEMMAALSPVRIPAGFGTLGMPEMAALVALGLIAGVLASVLILPMSRRGGRRFRVRDLRPLPVPLRLLVLSRYLGHLPPALRGAAYGSEPPPTDRRIERIALRSRLRRRWRG